MTLTSGTCRGLRGSNTSGFCCSAAAAGNCSKGCEPTTGECTEKPSVGEACAATKNATTSTTTQGSCYMNATCLNGTCCGFSPGSLEYYNCAACSSVNGSCTACAPGYTLDHAFYPYYIPYYMTPGNGVGASTVCRQICDNATEYRRSPQDIMCTKKMAPGSYCTSNDACALGLCGGITANNTRQPYVHYGFCCNQAATAAKCTRGCEYWTGECTTKAIAGEKCASSSDCYSSSSITGTLTCVNGRFRLFTQQHVFARLKA